jgi:phosphatidylinositol glycan class A protein
MFLVLCIYIGINIVILSRLVYRKGVDLVIDVIPKICQQFENVYFIIGGDGPKKLAIEEMREKYQVHQSSYILLWFCVHGVSDGVMGMS